MPTVQSRRSFLTRAAAGVGAAGFAAGGSVLWGTQYEIEQLRIERLEISLARLPLSFDGLRIVLLSDFHLHPHTRIEFIREVIEEARKLDPDVVFLGGDFVQETAQAIFELAPALGRLESRLGVYGVLGNHDYWKGPHLVRDELQRHGVEVLINRGIEINRAGASLYLAGVDDAWMGRPNLSQALDKCPFDLPVILLSHEPDPADEYCRDPRVILQLSGHSHGGQVRFPLVGSPFLPPFGEKYDQGLYRVHGAQLYTNVGIGVTVPIRFNCPPELTELTLVARHSHPEEDVRVVA